MYTEGVEAQSNIKLPPHELDSEEAVLGSLLIDPEAISKIADILKPEDFYREKNRWTFESCVDLYERSEAINQITVAQDLARRQRLEAVGGAAYMSHLVTQVPTSIHIEYYANIVRRLAMMRRLIAVSNQIAAIGYEAPPDIDEALNRAESMLFRLRFGRSTRDFAHIGEVLDRYFEESSLAPEHEGYLPHVPTGFTDLDKILGGMQRSDMIVLAARPSLGKTSLALNIAHHAALKDNARVALFSLEMSKMELAYRFLSGESGIDTQKLRLDQLNERQRGEVVDAIGRLSEAPIYIDDSPYLRESDVRSKARRLHSEKGIDLLIVDYLQLMRSSRFTDNRVQEMSDISHSMKEIARELDVPVIAVSQLSRAVEARHPHRPMLSDLRESGSIEQDADVVLFIYREDIYFTEEEREKQFPDQSYPRGIAEIIVAKHRNGPIGRTNLFFRDRIARFENLEKIEVNKPSLL